MFCLFLAVLRAVFNPIDRLYIVLYIDCIVLCMLYPFYICTSISVHASDCVSVSEIYSLENLTSLWISRF